MIGADLYGEVRKALAHPAAASLLAPLGLDPVTESMVGTANVRPDTDGLYIPDSEGLVTAAIIPVMPDDEIIDLVRTGPLDTCMESLWALVAERMQGNNDDQPSKPDDFSAILFRLN